MGKKKLTLNIPLSMVMLLITLSIHPVTTLKKKQDKVGCQIYKNMRFTQTCFVSPLNVISLLAINATQRLVLSCSLTVFP
jgi:hypothetical protein